MEMMKTKKGEQCVAHKKVEIRADGSRRVYTINVEPSRTKQEFGEDVKASNIMKKYSYNSLPDPQNGYNDLTDLPDLHQALETVRRAQDTFNTLPAHARNRFKNDPNELIAFLNDESNYEESIKLGLRNPKPVETPDPQLEILKEISKNTKKPKKADD